LAARVAAAAGSDPATQVASAFRLALGRAPDAAEAEVLVAMHAAHGLPAVCRALFNLNEFAFID
jgi:hypothetical protein